MIFHGECQLISEFPPPSQSCDNLVSQVRYHITHQGVEGVTALELYISLLDRQELAGVELLQEHRVTHSWAGENMTDLARLSGHPGYLLDKPLRSGYWDGSGPEPLIRLDTSATSLFKVKSDGTCDLESRDRSVS